LIEPLEVYTSTELRQSTAQILKRADENGALYVLRYPRNNRAGQLYKITALGKFNMTRKPPTSMNRPKLALKKKESSDV
jgi:hypothetical protein